MYFGCRKIKLTTLIFGLAPVSFYWVLKGNYILTSIGKVWALWCCTQSGVLPFQYISIYYFHFFLFWHFKFVHRILCSYIPQRFKPRNGADLMQTSNKEYILNEQEELCSNDREIIFLNLWWLYLHDYPVYFFSYVYLCEFKSTKKLKYG